MIGYAIDGTFDVDAPTGSPGVGDGGTDADRFPAIDILFSAVVSLYSVR